jgi:hypothetical protein
MAGKKSAEKGSEKGSEMKVIMEGEENAVCNQKKARVSDRTD